MNLYEIIGKNIKFFRNKLGWSQADMAKFLGIGREVLSYYETASREIPISLLEKISALFGVEVADMMSEEDPENVALNFAFAFRAESLNDSDLEAVQRFQRIVSNYLRMQNLVTQNEQV